MTDRAILLKKHHIRSENHVHSEKSKHNSSKFRTPPQVTTGDLVYLLSDRDKLRARHRYLVSSVDGNWCFIKKT